MKQVRHIIFLRDVLWLACTAFGGPHAHTALFYKVLVRERAYVTEEELLELQALCQVLPGPTSTQTITAVGFRRGGARLAWLTLLVWCLPALVLMIGMGLVINHLHAAGIPLDFARFIQPMAVGWVSYSALMLIRVVIRTKTAWSLLALSALLSVWIQSPWVLPGVLVCSGLVTSLKFRRQQQVTAKEPLQIEWANFILYVAIFVTAALAGAATGWLPIRLFENFYRNGSLIFGGGQVLIPALYNEFVSFKQYLSSEEFLSGYALAQAIPGPVFAFCGYLGTLSMRDGGLTGQLLGGLMASAGIFLPGTLMIFFVIRFWERLKQYRAVRASLEGINAAGAGLALSACWLLAEPQVFSWLNVTVALVTFGLQFSKIPTALVVLAGLLLGILLH